MTTVEQKQIACREVVVNVTNGKTSKTRRAHFFNSISILFFKVRNVKLNSIFFFCLHVVFMFAKTKKEKIEKKNYKPS